MKKVRSQAPITETARTTVEAHGPDLAKSIVVRQLGRDADGWRPRYEARASFRHRLVAQGSRKTEMNGENALWAMSPTMNMSVDGAQGPITPARPNSFGSSATSVSRQVGHLVMQAMTFFDSNREAAWGSLKDASALLHGEPGEFGINAPSRHSAFQRNGLAAWQAKRALQYVEGNLGSKMAVRDMADLVALSTSHFSRAFKQSVGCPPMTYVAARRVERAKLMMTSTRERLAVIALACGFADQSHFNRHFRRAVGMTPRLWRRIAIPNSGEG
jgi:AraC family transcriptional regulator